MPIFRMRGHHPFFLRGWRGPKIYNLDFNDARFCQAVPVEPGAYYQITCRVKAEAYDIAGEGANISIDNTFSKSNTARETDGEWVNLTLTGQAGPDQTEVVVLLRVGFYGAESRVRAWFDDVRMVKTGQRTCAGCELCDPCARGR